tara:strand:+ start:572 stop:1396 length:825 start_codon:yes stop_codon:yes gene_type:complete
VSYEESAFVAQQSLRHRLLDQHSHIRHSRAKDLAAHLLLLIEDSCAAWQKCATWLRTELKVERVDGGFACPQQALYYPGQAESTCDSCRISTIRGIEVDNRSLAVRKIWAESKPVVFASLKTDTLFDTDLRRKFITTGIESKIAVSLKQAGHAFGLLCIDRAQGRHTSGWSQKQYDVFDSIVCDVVSPIMHQIHILARETEPHAQSKSKEIALLTPAEMEIARLASSGMSYKEIAKCKGRSFHTIDHQLRSIRRKLNISSHAKLVKLLNGIIYD